MTLPKTYCPESSIPESLFVLPAEASTEINNDFLEETFKRLDALIWLLMTSARGEGFDIENRILRKILCQMLTQTTHAQRMFDHCRDAGGEK